MVAFLLDPSLRLALGRHRPSARPRPLPPSSQPFRGRAPADQVADAGHGSQGGPPGPALEVPRASRTRRSQANVPGVEELEEAGVVHAVHEEVRLPGGEDEGDRAWSWVFSVPRTYSPGPAAVCPRAGPATGRRRTTRASRMLGAQGDGRCRRRGGSSSDRSWIPLLFTCRDSGPGGPAPPGSPPRAAGDGIHCIPVRSRKDRNPAAEVR